MQRKRDRRRLSEDMVSSTALVSLLDRSLTCWSSFALRLKIFIYTYICLHWELKEFSLRKLSAAPSLPYRSPSLCSRTCPTTALILIIIVLALAFLQLLPLSFQPPPSITTTPRNHQLFSAMVLTQVHEPAQHGTS